MDEASCSDASNKYSTESVQRQIARLRKKRLAAKLKSVTRLMAMAKSPTSGGGGGGKSAAPLTDDREA